MIYTLFGFALALNLVIGLLILIRIRNPMDRGLDKTLREELRTARSETSDQARQLREEVSSEQKKANELLMKTLTAIGDAQKKELETLVRKTMDAETTQRKGIESLAEKLRDSMVSFAEGNRKDQEAARRTLEEKLRHLQESNEKKLDQMRTTVDEKLQTTLEKRLGESFKLVSERLEAVQRGLGEMKTLADGVGDLKRVLTNVKDRGTWGEYQLGAILEQILTPDQYAQNVRPRKGGETVEYAVKLPGKDGDASQVWLPMDAKFPKEDYERLLQASEQADAEGVKAATKALASAIQKSARDIQSKYIAPPHTTDFAIMFLPTEGLYAEVLRQPGLHDELQTQYRVLVTGPTTLSAILSSLRVGFQTLAIEERSHEVWKVLSAVKVEFGKFGGVLEKVKRQLTAASNTIEATETRSRAMERRLRSVEQMPESEAAQLLSLPSYTDPDPEAGLDPETEPS